MEFKDWILLVVPIVCNGFITVCFGKYIDNRFERSMHRFKVENDIKKQFRNKVFATKQDYINVIKSFSSNADNISEIIEQFSRSLQEAVNYCVSCKPILNKQLAIVSDISELYNEYLKLARTSALTEQDRKYGAIIWNNIGKNLDDLFEKSI